MNEQLSWRRLNALLRTQVIGHYRNWAIGSGVIVGVLLVGAISAVNDSGSESFYQGAFNGILLILGTIASSLAFTDLHDKGKNAAYLLLPASTIEKTLAPLLVWTVGLIAYLLLLTTATSLVGEGVNRLFFGRTNELFQPFDREVWVLLPRYLVVQSLFFLGAAWFRKAHYLKTLLALLIALVGFCLLALLALLVAGVVVITSSGLQPQADLRDWLFVPSPWLDTATKAFFGVSLVAVPVFCWFVAWLRVKETQVSHGL